MLPHVVSVKYKVLPDRKRHARLGNNSEVVE